MLRVESNNIMYDYIIVGAGVAGVFTAEILSRSGKKVLLIEKEKQIATESSGEQHGWAHFGAIHYSIQDPDIAQDRLDNLDILLREYKLPGNNLTIRNNQIISEDPENPINWYQSKPARSLGESPGIVP